MASGPSFASSHTPIFFGWAGKSSRRPSQSASGTITSPDSGTSGSSPAGPRLSSSQLSATMRRSLMSVAIYEFLEGFDADAVHHVDEAFGVAVATREVAINQPLDHVGHFGASERRADHLAQRRAHAGTDFPLVAADLDLVPLFAVLVDSEDADMADVVVAASVHAARDIEVELADVVQVVQVVEALLDRLGHRDRLGVGERTEIAARAADDVGEKPQVGRREAERLDFPPERMQIGLPDVGENQVLLVRDAQLAERIAIGEIGDPVHLIGGDVSGRNAGLLERERDRGVAGLLVREDIPRMPGGKSAVGAERGLQPRVRRRELRVARAGETALDPGDLFGDERGRAVLQLRPFGLDFLAEFLGAALLYEDLDAGLVDVVAPAVAVVDPQDGLEIGQEVRPREELADDEADHRRASETASHKHLEAHLALRALDRVQADVVHRDRGAVRSCAVHRDLELARKVGELRVERSE